MIYCCHCRPLFCFLPLSPSTSFSSPVLGHCGVGPVHPVPRQYVSRGSAFGLDPLKMVPTVVILAPRGPVCYYDVQMPGGFCLNPPGILPLSFTFWFYQKQDKPPSHAPKPCILTPKIAHQTLIFFFKKKHLSHVQKTLHFNTKNRPPDPDFF